MEQQLLKEIRSDNTEKVMEILQNPINLNIFDKKGSTPLHLALENSNMEVLNALIQCPTVKIPINYNILDEKRGITALAYAVELNYLEGVQRLLKTNADPNFKMETGQTALHLAALNNNVNCMKLLIKYGADINISSDQGTALHLSVKNQCNEAALYLLEKKKICLTELDSKGNTVLHEAVVQGLGDIVLQLFEKLNVMVQAGKKDAVTSLLNTRNNDGNSALHLAMVYQRETISDLILQRADDFGLDRNLKNNKGQTAHQIKEQIQQKEKEQQEEVLQRKVKAQEAYREKQQQRKQEKIAEAQKFEEEITKSKQKEETQKIIKDQYQQKAPYLFIIILIAILVLMYFFFKKEAFERKENFID